jgi:hypothetical protein
VTERFHSLASSVSQAAIGVPAERGDLSPMCAAMCASGACSPQSRLVPGRPDGLIDLEIRTAMTYLELHHLQLLIAGLVVRVHSGEHHRSSGAISARWHRLIVADTHHKLLRYRSVNSP